MEVFLILLGILVASLIVMVMTKDESSLKVVGGMGLILSIICLIFHLSLWVSKSRDYERFITQRNAFIETIHEARMNGSNPYESTSVLMEIARWNVELAEKKLYYHRNFLTKYYLDDRFLELKPIK